MDGDGWAAEECCAIARDVAGERARQRGGAADLAPTSLLAFATVRGLTRRLRAV